MLFIKSTYLHSLKSITEVDLPNPKSKKCETLNLELGKVVRNE